MCLWFYISEGAHALEVGDTCVTSEVTLGTGLCWLSCSVACLGFLQSLAVVSAPQQTKQTPRLGENLPFHGTEHTVLAAASPSPGINFVIFCKLTSCNGWVLVDLTLSSLKKKRFLGHVFRLEECKPKSASFLTCFFHLETKVKKWESEKTRSVSTEMWDKTLRITLK